MTDSRHFAESVCLACAVALAVWPALAKRGRANIGGAVVGALAMVACPALIPAECVVARAFGALFCIDLIFRLLDYARHLRGNRATRGTFWGYACFLLPFPFLLTVVHQKQQARTTPRIDRRECVRFGVALPIAVTALFICLTSPPLLPVPNSFAAEHVLRLVLFLLAVEAASQAQLGIERLCGYDAPPTMDRVYAAQTPAEFWCRFNQRVQAWLFFNVFVPMGGRKSRGTGIASVFLVSAAFHELLFDLATSRVTGYQFAFFVVQIPMVLVSPALKRFSRHGVWQAGSVRAATCIWFVATSPLFFYGVDLIFPGFYVNEPWLPVP